MCYVEGGKTYKVTGTAKKLKKQASACMSAWFALAAGYAYTAAAAAASGLGVGISFVVGLTAGYYTFAGNEYRQAFNYFSTKSQKSSKKYYMTTISFVGILTGVEYGAC